MPVVLALVEHQRQHRAQVLLLGVVAAVGFPDAAAVAQQAQRHPAVGLGLMFEQQVEPLPRRRGGAAHFEQQVGDGVAQLLVDEQACGAAQGRPEDAALVGAGRGGGGGLLGIGEYQAEQVIVGLMQGRCHSVTFSPLTLQRRGVRGAFGGAVLAVVDYPAHVSARESGLRDASQLSLRRGRAHGRRPRTADVNAARSAPCRWRSRV